MKLKKLKPGTLLLFPSTGCHLTASRLAMLITIDFYSFTKSYGLDMGKGFAGHVLKGSLLTATGWYVSEKEIQTARKVIRSKDAKVGRSYQIVEGPILGKFTASGKIITIVERHDDGAVKYSDESGARYAAVDLLLVKHKGYK